MHRIDTSGNVNGRFVTGNPATGQRATLMGADWPNAVQEALAYVIEHSGGTLVKGEDDQLYLAIVEIATTIAQALVGSGGGGGGGGGGVPTGRQVHAGGIASGGGALANDITITVLKAVAAEIVARTEDGKAITPKGLGDAMASGMPAGCTRLAGGWMLMTGAGYATANGTTVITLPTSFPDACLFAGCEGGNADPEEHDNGPYVSGKGTGSISIYNAVGATTPVTWFAIGR